MFTVVHQNGQERADSLSVLSPVQVMGVVPVLCYVYWCGKDAVYLLQKRPCYRLVGVPCTVMVSLSESQQHFGDPVSLEIMFG